MLPVIGHILNDKFIPKEYMYCIPIQFPIQYHAREELEDPSRQLLSFELSLVFFIRPQIESQPFKV